MERERAVMANDHYNGYALRTATTYRKGQNIFYKGETAIILNVKPVFIIKIEGNNKVVCGDVLIHDVCLKETSNLITTIFENF
jgi:hypothetical protein